MTSGRRSAKTDAVLAGVAIFAVLCGAAVLKLRSHPALVVALDSTTEVTAGSAVTLGSVDLTSTTETAVLIGTATPGAVVRVLDRSAVADASGSWRIPVDLVPGINRFQAVATDPTGAQVATSFTVTYTPSNESTSEVSTTNAVPSETTSSSAVAGNPTLTISSPLDNSVVTSDRITITGSASPGASVNAAGTVVTAAADGQWSARVVLKTGANRLKVTATSATGTSTITLNVRYNAPTTTTTARTTTTGPTTTTGSTSTLPVDTEPPAP